MINLKLLSGLFASTLVTSAVAQPIASGRYLIFAQPATSAAPELFWDVANGNAVAPVLGATPIIAQTLNQLPPSTTNQQWVANAINGDDNSGLYTFASALGPTSVFFNLDSNCGAVVSDSPALFNVTAFRTQFGRIFAIQPIVSNLAMTSSAFPTQQITCQPLAVGNVLQLWNFDFIGS